MNFLCYNVFEFNLVKEINMDFTVVSSWVSGLGVYLLFFLVVVALDLVSGVIRALMVKEFSWERLPGFILSALGYLMAWVMAEVLAFLPSLIGLDVSGYKDAVASAAPKVVYGFVLLKYVASMVKVIGFLQNQEKPEM